MPQTWRFDLGATTHPGQVVSFRVWAPRARRVVVRLGSGLDREVALSRSPGGFHESVVIGVQVGTRYQYGVDGGAARPDPASRGQADGPLGPSLVVETPHDRWLDAQGLLDAQGFRARVVHEGDALWSRGGAWTAAELSAHLASQPGEALRLAAVCEPSPVHGLPAALFAPARALGGSRALRALVATAHQAGLAVILRLPFDRLAPECGFLLDFGPWVEPWGDAGTDGWRLDLGTPQVRSLAVDAMLGWLAEYHVDLLELRVAGAWPGLPDLVGELTQRSAALGLPERPLRLVPPAAAARTEGGAARSDTAGEASRLPGHQELGQ